METPPPVPELVKQLRLMVDRIESILADGNINWYWRANDDEWSLVEVICHLRDVEREVHQWRYRALKAKDNAFLPGVSADEWAAERSYHNQDGLSAWLDFKIAREETIQLIDSFSNDAWERTGRHAFLGQTSLHEILYISVRHDELHWKQIQELVNGWDLFRREAK